jgi:hypothetical protein
MAIKYKTRTQKGAARARFSIPKPVRDQLDSGIRRVKLVIDGPTGHYEGTKVMMSGSEIYGKDLTEHGIKRNQPITVRVSSSDNGLHPKIPQAYLLPSEEADAELFEGGGITVQVNRFERNPVARKRCIRFYGPTCVVCGFDFEKTYGPIGAGFIHVHHLTPRSTGGRKPRTVDPHKDLRPVCPNCHEMLHRKVPPYSIKELTSMLSKQ